MVRLKKKRKSAFNRGQLKTALDCFVKAEELLGGDVTGIYLVPHQRAAMVTLLSNQAECYLRLKKHEEAIVQATKALQLDRRHSKSLLRRAKATISGCSKCGGRPSRYHWDERWRSSRGTKAYRWNLRTTKRELCAFRTMMGQSQYHDIGAKADCSVGHLFC